MKKIVSFLLIIIMLSFTLTWAAEDAPRGSVTLRWEYVQASVGGYAIYMWDGYAYREVDRVAQDILEWDSDEARIYPDEEVLEAYASNSVTESLFTEKGKGNRLRNNPNSLYRVMKDGTEHSYAEYKDTYYFKIGTINEYGEVVLSEPIRAKLSNWAEATNEAPEVSLEINAGDSKTTNRDVTLNIEATDDTTNAEDLEMRIANDAKENLESAKWQKYTMTKSWELSTGYGEKVVFVEIKDKNGESTIASDRITLEELIIQKLDFGLNTINGAHATVLDTVDLYFDGIDDLSGYKCSYKIDGEWIEVEIIDGRINVALEKANKNQVMVKLVSEDGTKEGEAGIIIWKL